MEQGERDQLIAQYEDGYRAVAESLLKITPDELDISPAPGKWTPRQIVHHLADSEMTGAVRFRVLLATEQPAINAYDQDAFAARLHYERPHEASLEMFRAARASTSELMGCLTDADWLREGTHSEMGRFGLETWLRLYAPHAHRHAEQIRLARGKRSRENT
jgi:DinB superfamily